MMKPVAVLSLALLLLLAFSCKKDPVNNFPEPPAGYQLSYGDTVYYLKSTSYTVAPAITLNGNYKAFPDDLNINNTTGEITVSLWGKSGEATQTGLKYRITYISPSGQEFIAHLVIAGINYQDRIYKLNQNDTVARPVYNANPALANPGGTFSSSRNKLAINPITGEINLKKTLDNGFFGDDPENDDWREVTISYKTNDQSTSNDNEMDVVVYYYTSVDNIPSNVSAAMRAHQDLLLGLPPAPIPVTYAPVDNAIKNIVFADKPRPPCIILLAN